MVKLAACFVATMAAQAGTYTYIGNIAMHSVLIAWGTVGGPGNTIGRDSRPMGKAVVKVGETSVPSDRNWAEVTGLKPDTLYDYQVQVDGQKIGDGKVRTYPEKATKLCFFVIG